MDGKWNIFLVLLLCAVYYPWLAVMWLYDRLIRRPLGWVRRKVPVPAQTDCAGGSPCSTCPDKAKCARGCVRQGDQP